MKTASDSVTFAVFTDLHLDIMHDGQKRLDQFLAAARQRDVDFIIQLGDFCYPENTVRCDCSPENLPINLLNAMHSPSEVPKLEMLRQFNQFEKPHYHVLGNHEFDFSSKEQTMKLYGMEEAYYAFRCGGWRFLVLDCSYFRDREGNLRDYHYGNYFDSDDLPYISERQLEWVAKELFGDPCPTIVFSHQPLYGSTRGIKNAADLLAVFEQANRRHKTVYLCMNGHTHLDVVTEKNGIYYYTLNSMSNHWMGTEYPVTRFDRQTEQSFPNLKYILPYEEPLYAIVTVTLQQLTAEGRKGRFVPPVPTVVKLEAGMSPGIADRVITWK